ncbi:MAG: glycosyltransferase family 2 protein [Candidatus Helarchaeota archaeon]
MKYSILMPYYRKPMIHNTFVSFLYHYAGREDYEIIVMEDRKNIEEENEHEFLVNTIKNFSPSLKIKHLETTFKPSYAPCRMFNVGAKEASGKFLILTNPECLHLTNILGGFDLVLSKNPNLYVIAAVLNADYNGNINKFEDFRYQMINWYQHSKYRNRRLHFCSVLSKETYNRVGGFDEGYASGFGREDVDFLRTLIVNKVKVITKDNIIAIHMKHPPIPDMKRLWTVNKIYYAKKWHETIGEFNESSDF